METFDFVVIGAGSAGCVLANRLTANGRYNVLLLEAGPRDTNPWIHIPLGYGRLFADTRVNWAYESEPESQLNGRRIFTPRGKVLGGSSSINGLAYIRGQARDFDEWNLPGWRFADLLPYFIKSEDQSRGPSAMHGVGGPQAVSDLPDRHPLCDAFIASAIATGIPANDDFNGVRQEGTGYFQATTRNGRRVSTAVGYLNPAKRRRNLVVRTEALATRVTLNGKVVTGVEYRHKGQIRQVSAPQVILAGGAINSPQLLELSGVGQAKRLSDIGVSVVVDSPNVGEHLQDHYYVKTIWRCNQPITINDELANPWRMAKAGARWLFSQRGPLTVSAGYAAAFTKTRPELEEPDAQLYFINFSASKMGQGLDKFSGFTCSMSQLQVESTGWVHATSSNPQVAPAIQYNYLSTESDRQVMVDGLKTIRRIVHTEPFGQYVEAEHAPGDAVQTDDEWLDYCRQAGSTVYHPTSTCRMGEDAHSVVDTRLRVNGVHGLRVVDASVMPRVVSGNTNAAVIAIAEKASDLILEDVKP
jgi:choline dehydrogenase